MCCFQETCKPRDQYKLGVSGQKTIDELMGGGKSCWVQTKEHQTRDTKRLRGRCTLTKRLTGQEGKMPQATVAPNNKQPHLQGDL